MDIHRALSVAAITSLVLGGLLLAPGAAGAAPFTPVAVAVTRVVQVQDPDPAPGQADGDFFARVQIDALGLETGPTVEGTDFEPFWVFSGSVDRAVFPNTVPVTVRLLDNDVLVADPDDVIDLNPADNVTQLVLDVDLETGAWTATNVPGAPVNRACFQGDGDTEHFGAFEGGEAGRICLDVSTRSADGDADGDGLLDGWEAFGLDADGDGAVNVDLPAFGADPDHKELFVELDVMAGNAPTRAEIQRMKAAFGNAPIGAGIAAAVLPGGAAAKPNPDGQPGINLWVDTGGLSDPGAPEDGGGPGTCGDGADNGGGDGADAADPDCLVGDDLGGGELLPATAVPDLDASFYALKGARFDPDRRHVFRYGVSAAPGFEDGAAAGNSCVDGVDNGGDGATDGGDDDCWPWGGGWGEIGGNDFVEYNHDGGTIMHELGHTLNLRHGGDEDANCKPSYVSVMNYDHQAGISQNAGGSILDYSPPRAATGRGGAPLGPLIEDALDETAPLDAGDGTNQFVFTNGNGAKVRTALNAPADYDGDGTATSTRATVNIDDDGGILPACDNDSDDDTIEGFHDWNAISLPFRQFGTFGSAAVNKVDEPEVTLPQLVRLRRALDTADLGVTKTDAPDPVAAGEQLAYTLTVVNDGPNPSDETVLTDTLPAEVAYVSDDAGCDHSAGVVSCDLGVLGAGGSATVRIVTAVDAAVVHDHGGPKTITDTVSVSNRAGPDPDEADNSASASTRVVAVADLAVDRVAADAPPRRAVIGEPFDVIVTSLVSNGGPSSPMDSVVTTSGSSPGNTVTPAARTTSVPALARGAPREVTEAFTLECRTPGVQTYTFDTAIAPRNAADADPDAGNDSARATVDVDCVVPVAVNVKPGGRGNPVNTRSTVPVGVLTTQAGEYGLPLPFDATAIDARSVRFGTAGEVFGGTGGAPERHGRSHLEDTLELDERTRDGDTDNVLHFRAGRTSLVRGDTEACVLGSFTAGGDTLRFFGCDAVRVLR